MNVLVCVKRVPAPGAKIVLTDDGTAIDTKHLGFTVSPHEECAVEEAVRIVAEHGGRSTVMTLGPVTAEEQLRTAVSMGVDQAVLVASDEPDPDPRAVAAALTDAIRTLESEGEPFDLVLFGNESADAGNFQVGIRVAHALGRPVVSGVKAITFEGDTASFHRGVADGFELCEAPLPAVAAIKEGINVPRYPAMRGRLVAAKAKIRHLQPEPMPHGLRTLGLRQPVQEETETVILGSGADAAPAVVKVMEQAGLL